MPITTTAPTGTIDHHSFFQFWAPRDSPSNTNPTTPSFTESPQVSPGTSDFPRHVRRPPLARSTLHWSATHSGEPSRLRKLEESPQGSESRSQTRPSAASRTSRPSVSIEPSRRKRSSTFSNYARTFAERVASLTQSSDAHLEQAPDVPRAIDYSSRKSSESSWIKRQQAKLRIKLAHSTRSGPQIVNTATGLMKVNVGAKPAQKLRPPVSQYVSMPVQQHAVKLETDFTEIEQPKPEKQSFPRSASEHGRRAYLKSKQRVRDNYDRLHRSPDGSTRFGPANDTTHALHRVSSMLLRLAEEQPQPVRKNPKISFFASSSPDSAADAYYIQLLHIHSPTLSETSSIRDLRQGPVPQGSPNPGATYRARLRPDGPSEEFMKIDISEHGGTSYLPSEARRIHTPPLPGDGPNQKRRGFFFDYNAPRHVPESTVGGDNLEAQNHILHGGSSSESGPATIGGLYPQLHSPGQRKKVGDGSIDWYTAQLLDLDRGDADSADGRETALTTTATAKTLTDSSLKTRIPTSRTSDSSTTTTSVTHPQRPPDPDKEIDYRIPDHYPSSPLCPRHPKHKSGGLGVCWMHGRNPPDWIARGVELRVGGTGEDVVCYRTGRGSEVMCYRGEAKKDAF